MNTVLTRLLSVLSILFLAVAVQAQGIGQERNLTLVPWLMRVVDPTGAELGSATLRITRQAPNADGFEIFGSVEWDVSGVGRGVEFVSGTNGDKFTFNSGPNGDGTIWVQLQGQEKVALSLPAPDGSPTTGSSVTVDYPIVKTDGTTASHRFVIARGANLPDATDIRLTIIR